MSTHGKRLALKLIMEGIEIDCVGATFSGAEQNGTQASIFVPYSVLIHDIPPRTYVALLYLEEGAAATDLPPGTTRAESWILGFVGEVHDIGYVKEGSRRDGVLTCIGLCIGYWQAARLYWGSDSLSLTARKNAVLAGATRIDRPAGSNGTTALINKIFAKPSSIPTLSGILGGLVALLESATGVFDSPAKKNFKGANDFMSQAELRLHLTRMIGAAPDDDTITAFGDGGDLRTYLRQVAASVQNTASYMDLVQVVLGKVYYTWAGQIVPPYIKKGAVVGFKVAIPRKLKFAQSKELEDTYDKTVKTYELVAKRLEDSRKRLTGEDGKADPAMEGKDPTRSVPSSVPTGRDAAIRAEHEKFTKECADIKLVDPPQDTSKATKEQITGNSRRQSEIRGLASKLHRTKGIPPDRASQFSSGLEKITEAVGYLNAVNATNSRNAKPGETPYSGHNTDNLKKAKQALEDGLKKISKTISNVKIVPVRGMLDSRLHESLFMPDLFMMPPPKCNVIFPDQYTAFRYNRPYMSEVTRVILYGRTLYGETKRTGYFSPNNSILAGPTASDAADAASKGMSFLMEHERFTGPIASVEYIGDNGVFRKLHRTTLNLEIKRRKKKPVGEDGVSAEAAVAGEAAYSPQTHMQRAANFLFLSRRYGQRSISLSAKFSPHLVVGLPALIICPEEDSVGQKSGGVHYFGVINSVSHRIDTDGAVTQVTLRSCRGHREGLDVFGSDSDLAKKTKKIVRVRKKSKSSFVYSSFATGKAKDDRTDQIADSLAASAGLTPSNSKGMTAYGKTKYFTTDGKPVRVIQGTTAKKKDVKIVVEPVTVGDAPIAESPLGNRPGESSSLNPLEPYKVTVEEAGKSTSVKNFKFNFEATATPPWYATIFWPNNIGKQYYTQMIGCDSILDGIAAGAESKDGYTEIPLISATGEETTVRVPPAWLDDSTSSATAAERLASLWSTLSKSGVDMDAFIRGYTSRAVTNMVDLLGGPGYNPALSFKSSVLFTGEAYKARGFHSDAFGPYKNLEKPDGTRLLEDSVVHEPGEKDQLNTRSNVTPRVDTRSEKYLAVSRYAEDISGRSTTG